MLFLNAGGRAECIHSVWANAHVELSLYSSASPTSTPHISIPVPAKQLADISGRSACQWHGTPTVAREKYLSANFAMLPLTTDSSFQISNT